MVPARCTWVLVACATQCFGPTVCAALFGPLLDQVEPHCRSASAPASSDTLRFADGACVSVYNTQRYLCNLPPATAHRLLRRPLPQPPLGRMSSYAVRGQSCTIILGSV